MNQQCYHKGYLITTSLIQQDDKGLYRIWECILCGAKIKNRNLSIHESRGLFEKVQELLRG